LVFLGLPEAFSIVPPHHSVFLWVNEATQGKPSVSNPPPLRTLSLDRPLKGALLVQTLALVNRTFRWQARRLGGGLRAPGQKPQQRAGLIHRD
jgi:hypothetical protein